MDGSPGEMILVDQASFLVALLENDNADPAIVQNRVVSIQAATSGLRLDAQARPNITDAERYTLFINNTLRAFEGIVEAARLNFPDPDDKIGLAQILTFTDQEFQEVQEQSRPAVERTLRFEGDEAIYEVTFALRLLDKTAKRQPDWKACRKCQGLFYGPFGGRCPDPTGGPAHDPGGSFNYVLQFR